MIKTKLKTAPLAKPVRIDGDNGVKQHLNLDFDFTLDDGYLQDLIEIATDHVEQLTGRRLISQSWYYYLEEWPDEDYIVMPFGKLQSVATVKYTDTAGSQTTWSNTEYIVEIASDPGKVVQGYGYTWPNTTLYPSNPIEIDFTCGYGAAGDNVPSPLRQAIKILVAELYENREHSVYGVSRIENPIVLNLIDQYKLFKF